MALYHLATSVPLGVGWSLGSDTIRDGHPNGRNTTPTRSKLIAWLFGAKVGETDGNPGQETRLKR